MFSGERKEHQAYVFLGRATSRCKSPEMEQNTVARPALFGSTDLGVEKAVSHPKITSCSFLRKIGSSSSYPEVSIRCSKKR